MDARNGEALDRPESKASGDTALHCNGQQGELTAEAIATATGVLATANPPDILTPDYAEAERFLLALDPDPNAVWCFRTFRDRVKSTGRNETGTLAQCWPKLCRDNAQQRGVFVVVNEGGHCDKDITRARAVWIDLDGPPLEPALAEVRAAVPGLEPGIVVDSSPGKWHPYWPIDPADPLPIGEFRAVQLRLIQLTGSDIQVQNESRVMRLPGFLHWKEEPRMVRVSKLDPIRYGASVLRQLLPKPAPVLLDDAGLHEAPPPAPPPPAGNLSSHLERMERMELDKRRTALLASAAREVASAPEKTRNGTLLNHAYTLAGALTPDGTAPLFTDAELREALTPAGLSCGLDAAEIARTLRNGMTAGRQKPYTLKDRDPPPKAPDGQAGPGSTGGTSGPAGEGKGKGAPIFRPWSQVAAELGAVKTWIIEGLLAPRWLTIWWGKRSAGKTFAVLDAGLSLACELETWAGRRLRCTGPVLYLAAEDPEGVAERIRAWEIHHGRQVPDTFMHASARVRLDVEGATQIQAELEGMPVKPSWLIVDTLARAGGFEEGDNTAAGEFISRLDAIREATGVAVTLVGHPGHEGTRLRGAYALTAAADVVMEVQSLGHRRFAIYADNTTEGRKLKNTGRTFAAEFKLDVVELGYHDCFGEMVDAGVAVHAGEAPAEGNAKVPKATTAAMQLVGPAWRCTGAEVSGGRPVIREASLRAYADGAGGSWNKYNTALRKLTEDGRLSPSPDGWLVVDPVWSAQLLLPLAIGDPVRHEAEQAAARRQVHEQAIVAALAEAARLDADITAARDGQQPAHKVLAPLLTKLGHTLTTGQFWDAIHHLKRSGRVREETVQRNYRPSQVLRLVDPAP